MDGRSHFHDEDIQPADGVLSNLLHLYGSQTLQMRGPSRTQIDGDGGALNAQEQRPIRPRSRSFVGRTLSFRGPRGEEHQDRHQSRHEAKARRLEIVKKLANVFERQRFLLKLAKALLVFGSPSHRIEEQLDSTARALHIDAQFIHLPLMIVCSFGDLGTRTSETFFVKAAGGFDLGRLKTVHELHNDVTHGEVPAGQATEVLIKLLDAPPIRSNLQLNLIGGLMGFIICPLGFGGSLIDAMASFAFNLIVQATQIHIASRNAAFQPIFEISAAVFVSFFARALAYSDLWCYNAVVSSGLCSVLPGMFILSGALELGSRKMISGSVKMVYAVVFSLFLGFGITIGSELYFMFNPDAEAHASGAFDVPIYTTSGEYDFGGNYTGTWTFTNATLLTGQQAAFQALANGKISCYRDAAWPWYRQPMSPWLFFLWVPIYAFLQCVSKMQPIRSKDIGIMWIIAVIGFVVNNLANRYIFQGKDITSFMGATVISLLGGAAARLLGGTAYTWTVPGILFLVPGGLAAAGGLSMTSGSNNTYMQGIEIGLRMVQTAIGIVIGVFVGAFLVYGVFHRKGKHGAIFAF